MDCGGVGLNVEVGFGEGVGFDEGVEVEGFDDVIDCESW